MPVKIAFAGFRHLHILDVYRQASVNPDIQIVAACEPDADARAKLPETVKVTHNSYKEMLDSTPCDAVAVGDYFSARGKIIIDALERGKHVVSDKPICTDLAELDVIEKLATSKKLAVVAQLDLVNGKGLRALRDYIAAGKLGKVHQINIGAQHPLMYGIRVPWYYEPGKQGGTLNDIGIHAIHALPWLTGSPVKTVVAAREWNAFASQEPTFKDSAQAMIAMENGCGVLLDVSYSAPTSHGYKPPHYWRFTAFGTKGIAETTFSGPQLKVWLDGNKDEIIIEPSDAAPEKNYLTEFIAQAQGKSADYPMRTSDVIHASRQSLKLQMAADKGLFNLAV